MSVKYEAVALVAVSILELVLYVCHLGLDIGTIAYYFHDGWPHILRRPTFAVGVGLAISLVTWIPLLNGVIAKNSWHRYSWKIWTIQLLTLSVPVVMLIEKIKLALEALTENDTTKSKKKLIKANLALNHQIKAVCEDYQNPPNATYKSCISDEDVQAFQVMGESSASNNVQTPTSSASISISNQPVMGLSTYLMTAYSVLIRSQKVLFYQMTESSAGNLIDVKTCNKKDDFDLPNRVLSESGAVICNDTHYYAQFNNNATTSTVLLVKRTSNKKYAYIETDYTKLIWWHSILSFTLKLYGLFQIWYYYPGAVTSLMVLSPILSGLIWLLVYRWSRDSWAVFSVRLPIKFTFWMCRILVLCAVATNNTTYAVLLFIIGKFASSSALCFYLAFMKMRKNNVMLLDPVERYLFETKNDFLLQLVEGIIYSIAGFFFAEYSYNKVMGAAVAIFTITTQVGGLLWLWFFRKWKKFHWDFQNPAILLQQLKNIEKEREIVYTNISNNNLTSVLVNGSESNPSEA
ncbi:unnamed protein product [Meganyctiphanes norvegica]|uniref:XK-related protein n=1 Tax=Meganyctiphanes norvegica TaxID=48144 RepID=A0AAV2S8I9_MEGNR